MGLVLTGLCSALAEAPVFQSEIAYDDLPAEHRQAYEEELAKAIANAQSRLLSTQARGDFNGYTGVKADNSLQVNFKISQSMVPAGQSVSFSFDIVTDADKLTYTIGGSFLNEKFQEVAPLVSSGSSSREVTGSAANGTSVSTGFKVTPPNAGYILFVLVISDSSGNLLAVTPPTVQAYEGDVPTFDNIGTDTNVRIATDNQLGVRLTADKTSVRVGEKITATATLSTYNGPIQYEARWIHSDADGNQLVLEKTTGQVKGDTNEILSFAYVPLKAGEIQFWMTATDADGNSVEINTPWLAVADGYHITLSLDANKVNNGKRVTATYKIEGHECNEDVSCRIVWECYAPGAGINDAPLGGRSDALKKRSGTSSCIPRIGQDVLCYVEATCKHTRNGEIPVGYAEVQGLVLVGGLNVDMSLTSSTVTASDQLGLTYSLSGGLTPYQRVTVTGYCQSAEGTSTFLSQTLTQDTATVYGNPGQSGKAYFEITVVEADGFTTTWSSGTAVVNPRVAGDVNRDGRVDINDALLIMEKTAGWSVSFSRANADVDGNGVVNVQDALLILKACSGQAVLK